MAWETRNGKGRYYTRSRKEGGRVVRVYIGTGVEAEQAAAADRQRRARLLAEHTQRSETRGRYAQADDALAAYCDDIETQLRAALEAVGYHRHKGEEWRRRRGSTSD